jgi:hypothetical protein
MNTEITRLRNSTLVSEGLPGLWPYGALCRRATAVHSLALNAGFVFRKK